MRPGPSKMLLAVLLSALLGVASASTSPSRSAHVDVASSGPLELEGIPTDLQNQGMRKEVAAPSAESTSPSPYTRGSQQVIRWPEEFWAKNYRATTLWASADAEAVGLAFLPQWSWLEFRGKQSNGRLLVRDP